MKARALLYSCVALCFLLSVVNCARSKTVVFQMDGEGVLTEAEAIRISRKALEACGLDVSAMTPVPYSSSASTDQAYFARNELNTGRGRVLWHRAGLATTFEYSVVLEVSGNDVRCSVIAAK